MKKAWKIFDKNGDGKLTPQEFRYKRKSWIINHNHSQKDDYDENWDGEDDDDMMTMVLLIMTILMMMITTLTIMMTMMTICRWMTRQSMLSERQIDMVFQRFDTDGDGNLNFKEFKT